ncbi:MAG: hypothetical protein ACYDCL_21985 [Myxococcales bacterium]
MLDRGDASTFAASSSAAAFGSSDFAAVAFDREGFCFDLAAVASIVAGEA